MQRLGRSKFTTHFFIRRRLHANRKMFKYFKVGLLDIRNFCGTISIWRIFESLMMGIRCEDRGEKRSEETH
jgi:hypothetical protein